MVKRNRILKIAISISTAVLILVSGSFGLVGAQYLKGTQQFYKEDKARLVGDWWRNDYSAYASTSYAIAAMTMGGQERGKITVRVSTKGWSDNKFTADYKVGTVNPSSGAVHSHAKYADNMNMSTTLYNTKKSSDGTLQQDNYWYAIG